MHHHFHKAAAALLGCVFSAACGQSVTYPAGLSWGEPPVPAYVHQERIAITDNGDDTLAMVAVPSPSAMDALQPQLLGLAPVGNSPLEELGPHHLAASPDGRYIYYNLSNYVTNGGSGPHGAHGTGTVPGYLVKLDARTMRAVGQVLVDRSPGDVILSPDGKLAYVSHYDLARLNTILLTNPNADATPDPFGPAGQVAIIDTQAMQLLSMTPVCACAHGMGLSADNKTLYVTCTQSDQIAVLDITDPTTPAIVAKTHVGPAVGPVGNPRYAPYALVVGRDGRVWISDSADATGSPGVRPFVPSPPYAVPASGVSIPGPTLFGDLGPAGTPAGAADGQYLYVASQGARQLVTEIDTAASPPKITRQMELPSPSVCISAHMLRVLPAALQGGGALRAAVTCEGDHLALPGTMVFVDLAAWKVGGFASLGIFSDGQQLLPAL